MINFVSGFRPIYRRTIANPTVFTYTGEVISDVASSLTRKTKYAKPTTKVKVTGESLKSLGLQGKVDVKPPAIDVPTGTLRYSRQVLDFFTEHISVYKRKQPEIQQALDEILSLKDIKGRKLYTIRHDVDNLYGKRTYSARALLEAKFNDPQRYDDIMQLLKLHQSGKIKYCPGFIMPNGKLNPLVKQDMEAITSGKPYFQQFKPFTNVDNNILNGIKEGDVFSVGERMYVRNRTGYEVLKMDKNTYELLFPPVDRYAMAQGASDSCGVIAMINNLVQVPSNRVKMYQMFEQNGNKVTVHALGDVNNIRTFDLNNLKVLEDNRLSETSIGLKMLEQKGCISNEGSYIGATVLPQEGDKGIHYSINANPFEFSKVDFVDHFWSRNNPAQLEEVVKQAQAELSTIGNGRTLITLGGSGYKFGMGSAHCCSVYDCNNGLVKVANPNGTADCLEIPLDLFYGKQTPYFTNGVFDNI